MQWSRFLQRSVRGHLASVFLVQAALGYLFFSLAVTVLFTAPPLLVLVGFAPWPALLALDAFHVGPRRAWLRTGWIAASWWLVAFVAWVLLWDSPLVHVLSPLVGALWVTAATAATRREVRARLAALVDRRTWPTAESAAAVGDVDARHDLPQRVDTAA